MSVFSKYYPKQITPFKDPAPSLSGPNTSTISGLSPTPPKADALVASAKSTLPTVPATPSVPPIPSAPSLPSVGNIPSTPTLNSAASSAASNLSGITSGLTGTGVISGTASGAASKVSKWRPYHFSPSSTVNSKIDVVTGQVSTLPSTVPAGLPPISSITSQAPKTDLSSVSTTANSATNSVTSAGSSLSSTVSVPTVSSVSLPAAPSVSIPSTAIPSGTNVNSISDAAGKMSTNISNSIKGGVNRIQKIKLPKPATSDEINSKFNNLV